MKKLNPLDFIDMSVFTTKAPLRVDIVYAQANHPRNIFGEALYHDKARLWAHKDIAKITLLAALRFYEETGLYFSVKDCLRTTDAQQAMQETAIVRKNPHWCEEPSRLLSPPGMGGHPRGMAIDITLQNDKGEEIEMGTPFDYLSEDPDYNPAARAFQDLPEDVLKRRVLMQDIIMLSAKDLNLPFVPLSSEWWDYRFPASVYNEFYPLCDADLPDEMKMTQKPATEGSPDRSAVLDEIEKSLVFLS